MASALPFAEVLEAVDHLSADEQEMLIFVTRRRLAEQGRKRVTADVQEAREDFAAGSCRPTTADEIMREITA
ncbi:MAG TPA: hypothetical protein VGY55_12880 [Pirellulales bacterium]|nr:hypothetical protein [Pirellulales bacterium]